jgi:hypothetical protein
MAKLNESGLSHSDAQMGRAAGDGGHSTDDTRFGNATIAEIIVLSRQRRGLHRAEKSLTLQIKANCRWLCDGDKKDAAVLYRAMFSGRATHQHVDKAHAVNAAFINARLIVAEERDTKERRLRELAKDLPAADFVTDTPGFDWLSLALIVGDAGDLSAYANPAKLWKRFGLAVMPDGGAQRRVKDAKLAVEFGFAPQRRALIWAIGQAVFFAQSQRTDKETGEIKREAGPYRVLYDERKALEKKKAPDAPPILHDKRAHRYCQKRLLRELWKAWRRPSALVEPRSPLAAANEPD